MVSKRTLDILTLTGQQLSGTADYTSLLDNALKGQGDHPKGYVYAAEVCEAEVVDGEVELTPVAVIGSNTARITARRVAQGYAAMVGRPVKRARIRLYGQL